MEPFEVLVDDETGGGDLPEEIRSIWGGGLSWPREALFANFVSSIDGVVALGDIPSAGSVISGKAEADRFVMALLRASADAVIVGAGTMRGSPGHHWTPQHVAPALAPVFARMRAARGQAPDPRLVLLTNSGRLDVSHASLNDGPIVITSGAGARNLASKLPPGCELRVIGPNDEHVDIRVALDSLRSQGMRLLLSEGGPHVLGEMIQDRLLDELFLTLSPVVAGRAGGERLGVVEGVELLPDNGPWTRLRSVRRHSSYLFLRYAFDN